jgi:hypothetical protein
MAIVCWDPLSASAGRQETADAIQILWCIDADRVVLGFDHPYRKAMFEHAQLFKCLGPLERGRGEAGNFQEKFTPLDIQPDMSKRC